MGVEDYIRARRDQYYPNPGEDRILSPPQQKSYIIDRATAGNGLPPSRFMRPLSLPFQETEIINQPQNNYFPSTIQQEKSVFDTDVENVDDSTITVTSVGDIEESRDQDHDHDQGIFDAGVVSHGWDGSILSESDDHQPEEQFQVAEVMKHRRKSTVPLVAADEDVEYANGYDDLQPFDRIQFDSARYHQSTAMARSKRNLFDKPPHVSRIPRAKSRMTLQRSDSDPGARARSTPKRESTVQVPLYRSGYSRTSNFPHSLATTPTNRFNFKTERSYERLIQQQSSPTRKGSGSRSRRHDSANLVKEDKTRGKHVQSSSSSGTKVAANTTDDDDYESLDIDIDDDEGDVDGGNKEDDDEESTINMTARSLIDSKRRRKSSTRTIPGNNTQKHHQKFTSDYPDEILQQMDFSELEREPFDHNPSSSTNHAMTLSKKAASPPTPPPPPSLSLSLSPSPPRTAINSVSSLPPPGATTSPSEKLGYVMNGLSTTPERHKYISSMSLTEWEEFGDELIDQMSEMLKLMKESRQSRRRTTALFEAEIRRRHDETQVKSVELDKKFTEMKQGGLGVLRALNPKG